MKKIILLYLAFVVFFLTPVSIFAKGYISYTPFYAKFDGEISCFKCQSLHTTDSASLTGHILKYGESIGDSSLYFSLSFFNDSDNNPLQSLVVGQEYFANIEGLYYGYGIGGASYSLGQLSFSGWVFLVNGGYKINFKNSSLKLGYTYNYYTLADILNEGEKEKRVNLEITAAAAFIEFVQFF